MRVFINLFFVNVLVQVIVFVPSILLQERFTGGFLAIPGGIIVGTALVLLFVWSMNQFPGQGLPEMMQHTSAWYRIPLLLFMALMWFSAGLITMISITDITIRFINVETPGTSMIVTLTLFISIILFIHRSEHVISFVEVVLVFSMPLIFIIFFQALRNENLQWPAIMEVATHIQHLPSYQAIAASSYMFTGYTNLIIFNRLNSKPIPMKWLWFAPVLGIVNLLTSFCIPVGLHGADGVTDYTYPWVITADSLRIEYGPIERLTSIFLLLYIGVSTISILIHWHVMLQLLYAVFRTQDPKSLQHRRLTVVTLALLTVAAYFTEKSVRAYYIFDIAEVWMQIRLGAEFILVGVVLYLAMRRKKA
ncbi:hypothetical protein [Paenibacillus sp. YYML68]|uniref:hypothetical protein n=1 Tax=Paenibacillus sp. YYML68 TaxID=2909250 RepID=UPI0024939282|nr:hypothetical protein [Paenibacillus sp. YYML68]